MVNREYFLLKAMKYLFLVFSIFTPHDDYLSLKHLFMAVGFSIQLRSCPCITRANYIFILQDMEHSTRQ
jgi:hypothetical protein